MSFLPIIDNSDVEAVKRLSHADKRALTELINAADPHNIFQPAGDSRDPDKRKIICPVCGNGTGDDATPIEVTRDGDVWLYNCFKGCGFSGNLVKIIANEENLNRDNYDDFCRVLAIGARFAAIDVAHVANYDTKPATQMPKHKKQERSSRELAMIKDDIEKSRDIGLCPKDQWRGLTPATLQHFNIGYLENWTHPKSRLEGYYSQPTRRIIIPTPSNTHYNAVALPADRAEMEKLPADKRKYWKPKQHAGDMKLFNPAALFDNKFDLVVVVEGEFDCVSIWQAFSGNLAVVATLGVGNWKRTLLPTIDNRLDDLTGKKFLILFDAEEDSRKASKDLRGELIKRGLPAACRFYFDAFTKRLEDGNKFKIFEYDQKLDANQILQRNGDDWLRDVTQEIIDDAQADLADAEKEIKRRATEIQQHPAQSVRRANLPPEYILSEAQRKILFSESVSDLANAERLKILFGNQLRYLFDAVRWLTYKNGVWTKSANAQAAGVMHFVTKAARILRANAHDDDDYKIVACFENSRKSLPAINYIKGLDGIQISESDLDKHNFLLNCKNGVIDLQTGKLLQADPKLLITRQVNAVYKGLEYRDESNHVDKFLRDIQPDDETREGLLSFLGYSLTGEIRQHVAHFWRGGGRNGKSTLINLLLRLLNNYAVKLPTAAVLASNRPVDADRATTALNPLEGARLAVIDELPRNAKLDIATFKLLTGGDVVPGRRLHEEYRTFPSTAKLIFNGNFLPQLDDVHDLGLTERLRNVPFNQTFVGDRADVNLKDKLSTSESLSTFLSILVEASIRWNKDGLSESNEMLTAKQSYIADSDFIATFVEDHCTLETNLSIPRNQFLERLKKEYPVECSRLFGNRDRAMTEAIKKVPGISYMRDKRGNKFVGVGWNQSDDLDGEPLSSQDYQPEF